MFHENIKEFLHAIANPVVIIDKERNIVFANASMLKLCGVKDETAIINKKCYEFQHSCEGLNDMCALDVVCPHYEIFKTGESKSVTHCHVMPDGSEKLLDIVASPLRAHDGSIAYIVEVIRDVTECKKAEDLLKKSEKRLRDIVSSVSEGLYVLDKEGKLLFMNSEAERLLGYKEDELLGKKVHNIIHSHKPDGTPILEKDCPVLKTIASGKKYHSDNEFFIKKNSTHFPAFIMSSPIIENGNTVGSVAVFRDITERKKMWEDVFKAKKMECNTQFISGFAHDFNNLMAIILGYVSLSRSTLTAEDKLYKNLSLAEDACLVAKDLIYQLIRLSAGEAAGKRVLSIEKLLKNLAELYFIDTRYRLELSISEDLLPVEVDEGQMSTVFHNVIVNACESMPEGGVIKISAENIKVDDDDLNLKDGQYIKIAVRDNGMGISPEDMGKIFDPYFTTKKRDSRKGIGLGLAISYSLIKKHHGYISIDSRVGDGTTVSIYLPAAQKKEGAQNEDIRPETTPSIPLW